MVNKVANISRKLKGFEQHGVEFVDTNETQAIGFCPFCHKPGKFYANKENLLWDCKSCGRSGNFSGFLKQRMNMYQQAFTGSRIKNLSENRDLKSETLKAWGLGWSGSFYALPLNGNPGRHTTDIKRIHLGKKSYATIGAKLSFMVPQELTDSDRVWICEGEWDGGALWECLRALDINDDVYCAPGAGVFPIKLIEMFFNKHVIVVYDHDEPGKKGCLKVASRLESVVKKIEFVHWSEGLPDGFDFRDYYVGKDKNAQVVYDGLLEMLESDPPMDIESKIKEKDTKPDNKLTGKVIPHSYVTSIYKKWLSMQSYEALEVMFGTIFANRLEGDPLWMFMVSPPGGGKSELLMSVSDGPRIYPLSSLTPRALVSGASFSGGADPSLIPKLDKHTLVVKDFTTILGLNSFARDEIFGTLRDAYDGKISQAFGNNVERNYTSKFGILAGVTFQIETLSTLNVGFGERFLQYNLPVSRDSRDTIKQAILNVNRNEQMKQELSAIGSKTINREIGLIPELPNDILEQIIGLAQWIALMRSVVSRDKFKNTVNFKPVAEVGTRIAKQLAALAYGISIYKNESVISSKTYQTLVSVAKHTAPSRVESIVKIMTILQSEFASTQQIADRSTFPLETTRFVLQDLALMGIVIHNKERMGYWKINPNMLRLTTDLGLYRKKPRIKKLPTNTKKRKRIRKLT